MEIKLYTFQVYPEANPGDAHPTGNSFKLEIYGLHGDEEGKWSADPHALRYLGQGAGHWASNNDPVLLGTGFWLLSHEPTIRALLRSQNMGQILATLTGMEGWKLRLGQTGPASFRSPLFVGAAGYHRPGLWKLVAKGTEPSIRSSRHVR